MILSHHLPTRCNLALDTHPLPLFLVRLRLVPLRLRLVPLRPLRLYRHLLLRPLTSHHPDLNHHLHPGKTGKAEKAGKAPHPPHPPHPVLNPRAAILVSEMGRLYLVRDRYLHQRNLFSDTRCAFLSQNCTWREAHPSQL